MKLPFNLFVLAAAAQISAARHSHGRSHGHGHIGHIGISVNSTLPANSTLPINTTLPISTGIPIPSLPIPGSNDLDTLMPCIKELLSADSSGNLSSGCANLLQQAIETHETKVLERRHEGRLFPFANRTEWTHISSQGELQTAVPGTLTTMVMPKATGDLI